MLPYLIVILSLSIPNLLVAKPPRNGEPAWIGFGDLRGYIEPCGCNPETDLGGIVRIGQALESKRKLIKNPFVFHLGNLSTINSDPSNKQVRNQFLNRAMNDLQISASLINEAELTNKSSTPQEIAASYPRVLSNLKSDKDLKAFSARRSIQLPDAEIYGFFYKPKYKGELYTVKDFLKRASGIINKNKWRFLLFSGSDKDLAVIAQSGYFSTIIASNQAPWDKLPEGRERQKPELLVRYQDTTLRILQVPFAGQGILLGGALQNTSMTTLDELLSQKPRSDSIEPLNGLNLPPKKEVEWLDLSFHNSGIFSKIMEEYNLAQGNVFSDLIKQRKADLKSSPFAGAEACKNCHQEANSVWHESSHRTALDTLKAKNRDKNIECVKCHVLGAKTKGGFVSEPLSPGFAGVQCENCHGPRLAHTKNPTLKPANGLNAKAACAECHHPPHTVSFNYERYWKRIQHGN